MIHPGHESWNMVCNIMLGIRMAVASSLDMPLIKATDKEFNLKSKFEIAPYRSQANDAIKACTFYDYAPQIFAGIRKSSGIKKKDYSESLGPDRLLGYMFSQNF